MGLGTKQFFALLTASSFVLGWASVQGMEDPRLRAFTELVWDFPKIRGPNTDPKQ